MSKTNPHIDGNFRPVAGLAKVYDPFVGRNEAAKKHSCPDCASCQFCSDVRCQSCRGRPASPRDETGRKLSLREQIALYEKINAGSHKKPKPSAEGGEDGKPRRVSPSST